MLRQNVAGRGATTEAVVADMRRALGLGPKRFEATLARNAKLRALVRERVTITESRRRNATPRMVESRAPEEAAP